MANIFRAASAWLSNQTDALNNHHQLGNRSGEAVRARLRTALSSDMFAPLASADSIRQHLKTISNSLSSRLHYHSFAPNVTTAESVLRLTEQASGRAKQLFCRSVAPSFNKIQFEACRDPEPAPLVLQEQSVACRAPFLPLTCPQLLYILGVSLASSIFFFHFFRYGIGAKLLKGTRNTSVRGLANNLYLRMSASRCVRTVESHVLMATSFVLGHLSAIKNKVLCLNIASSTLDRIQLLITISRAVVVFTWGTSSLATHGRFVATTMMLASGLDVICYRLMIHRLHVMQASREVDIAALPLPLSKENTANKRCQELLCARFTNLTAMFVTSTKPMPDRAFLVALQEWTDDLHDFVQAEFEHDLREKSSSDTVDEALFTAPCHDVKQGDGMENSIPTPEECNSWEHVSDYGSDTNE